jgi:hypothetical protein
MFMRTLVEVVAQGAWLWSVIFLFVGCTLKKKGPTTANGWLMRGITASAVTIATVQLLKWFFPAG